MDAFSHLLEVSLSLPWLWKEPKQTEYSTEAVVMNAQALLALPAKRFPLSHASRLLPSAALPLSCASPALFGTVLEYVSVSL